MKRGLELNYLEHNKIQKCITDIAEKYQDILIIYDEHYKEKKCFCCRTTNNINYCFCCDKEADNIYLYEVIEEFDKPKFNNKELDLGLDICNECITKLLHVNYIYLNKLNIVIRNKNEILD